MGAVGYSARAKVVHRLEARFGFPSLPLLVANLPLFRGLLYEFIEFIEWSRMSTDSIQVI